MSQSTSTADPSGKDSQESTAPAKKVDKDYPLSPVPQSGRRPTLGVVIVLASFFFFTPTMISAAEVSVEFDFTTFIGLAFLSAVILCVYVALLAVVSARTGLTSVLLSRAVFGRVGGKWASLLLGVTQIGWYAVTLGTLAGLMGQALGWDVLWPVILLFGVLMAANAYLGVKALEVIGWIAMPLMTILCIWVLILSLEEAGGWGELLGIEGQGGMSAGVALTIMISTFISGGTQVGNYARFFRSGQIALIATLVSLVIVQFAMLFFGGVGAAAFGIGMFDELLLALGLIGPALILLIANLWTTNDNTAYNYGVAGSELFGKPDKRPFIVVGTAIGIALAMFGFDGMIIPYLNILGVMIPPLGGAVLGMYFLAWKRKNPVEVGKEPMFRPSGLIAYISGVAAAAIGTAFDLGSPAVQGIIVAVIVAGLSGLVQKRTSTAH